MRQEDNEQGNSIKQVNKGGGEVEGRKGKLNEKTRMRIGRHTMKQLD